MKDVYLLSRNLGMSSSTFYFRACGEVNTEKTLDLVVSKARELGIRQFVVASETGLSALKAAKMLRGSGISLIVVTSAAGTKIEDTAIGDLQIGIPDAKIWDRLKEEGATIVRATDPLYNVGAALEHSRVPTLATIIRLALKMISSGIGVCISAVLMATDNGAVQEGKEVAVAAGSWVGLDTGIIALAANSVNMLKPGSVQVREIICKPRNPAYSWPVNQKDWVGSLEPYRKYAMPSSSRT